MAFTNEEINVVTWVGRTEPRKIDTVERVRVHRGDDLSRCWRALIRIFCTPK